MATHKTERYHLLYIKSTDTFKLDTVRKVSTDDVLRLTNKMLKYKEADKFVVFYRSRHRKRAEITHESLQNDYDLFYSECSVCGKVFRTYLKRLKYKGKCRECYADLVSRPNYNKYFRMRNRKIRIANVKDYLNSKLGQVNRVGIVQIRENIKYVAAMQGYNYSHIADHMGITHASFKMMMRKKYIDLKTMYEIAGFLQVPLERLTRNTMFGKVKDKRKFGVLTRIYDGRPQYKE